jgi:YgiT-type zinc finger domain-containing protein
MTCVICKTGEVQAGRTVAEIKVAADRLLVSVEAETCRQCGEAYYSAATLRALERVRQDFVQKAIKPPAVGAVYHVA